MMLFFIKHIVSEAVNFNKKAQINALKVNLKFR
jgi:hypothetical protein